MRPRATRQESGSRRRGPALTRRSFITGAAATAVLTVGVGALVEGSASAAPATTKPAFTHASPHAAVKGKPYSYRFIASGAPRYSVASGALPKHLTLHPVTGVLSGTPVAVGTAAFRIQATNARGHATTRPLTIHTSAQALTRPVNIVRPVISTRRPVVGERIRVSQGTWA